MISKFLAGGVAAAFAVAAVLLVTLGTTSATSEAAVNGLSIAPTTINAGTTNTSVATLDVDGCPATGCVPASHEINILLSTGSVSAVSCINLAGTFTAGAAGVGGNCGLATNHTAAAGVAAQAPAATGVTSIWVGTNAIPGGAATADFDTILATINAPATGPSTIVVTAIQGTSVKTGNITVRGTAAEVTVGVHTGVNAGATAGNGIAYKVVPSNTATVTAAQVPAAVALATPIVVTNVKDSAGTNLASNSVVVTTTAGTVNNPASLTNPSGNAGLTGATAAAGCTAAAATCTTLTGGTTGTNGTEGTLTANTGGKSGTTTVKFGGDPSSCTVTGNPDSTTPGTTSVLTGEFKDSSGGPIPDGVAIAFATVNATTGSLAIVGTSSTSEGKATTNLLLGAPGGVAIAASLGSGAIPPGAPYASLSCQNSILVSGQTAPPTSGGGTGGTGDGTISGTLPTSGFGLVTFGGSVDQLKAALATACPSGAPIFATSGGAFVGYFSTTTLEAPNAGFLALYGAAGLPANTPLLGGNC